MDYTRYLKINKEIFGSPFIIMKKYFYKLFSKTSFWICLGIGVILMILGFILPPLGVVDQSVLIGLAELLAFAVLGMVIGAVGKGNDITFTHGNTSVTIDNDEEEKVS